MDIQHCRGIVINSPEYFADPAFREWLANGQPKFTWFTGQIDEWSDVIVLVDTSLSGEGSDSDMPEPIWNQIVAACAEHLGPDRGDVCHYMVRLTNLAA